MLKIIDVSTWNTVTDWKKVKASGVDMVIVKATQGHSLYNSYYLFTDSKFRSHIQGALSVGLPVGVYHFFTGTTRADAIKEADYFCKVIAPFKNQIAFAACDAENYNNIYLNKLSRTELTDRINEFCERVKSQGLTPIHYTNVDHISRFININDIPYPVWIASYGKTKPTQAPSKMIMWQYSQSGRVDGISGNVDMNYAYFEHSDFINPKPEPKPDPEPVIKPNTSFAKGDRVKVIGAVKKGSQLRCNLFNSTKSFVVYYDSYEVIQANNQTGRIVIGRNGVIVAAVDRKNLEKV